MNRPNFTWDATQSRYRRNGRFVSADAVVDAMDGFLKAQQDDVADTLFNLLRDGAVNVKEVQLLGERAIARAHLASAMAAKGGRAQMSQADYGRVGALVRPELGFWRDRMKSIANGSPVDGYVRQSFRAYFAAAANTFFHVENLEMQKRGMDEYLNVLDDGANHCEDGALPSCKTVTRRGWRKIGTLPQRGIRTCRWRCHCKWKYRNSAEARAYRPAKFSRDVREVVAEITATGALVGAEGTSTVFGRSVAMDPQTKEDIVLREIRIAQGFDALPALGTEQDVVSVVEARRKAAGLPEEAMSVEDIHRFGVAGAFQANRNITAVNDEATPKETLLEFAEQFRSGPLYHGPQNRYGSGTYFYAGNRRQGANKGVEINAAFRPEARIIDFDDLVEQMRRDGYDPTIPTGSNPGYYAAAKGYDAYFVVLEDAKDIYYVVLNRSALIVRISENG